MLGEPGQNRAWGLPMVAITQDRIIVESRMGAAEIPLV